MRNSHKLLLGALVFMLAALRPDFASFLPQGVKVLVAGLLLFIGLYQLWRERRFWK